MAYESQMTNLARGATTAHGSLREVVFLKPNKESLLVFSDGTVLPISHQRAGYDIRRETYAYQVASELGGTDPFSLLTFGYSGTGPRCYAVFLSTAGFQNSNVEEIISPTKLRPDGSKVSGIEQGGSIVWEDRSETPRIQANEPGEANVARTDSTGSNLGILFDIEALGGGFYGSKAWRILMKHLHPSQLIGCVLKEGDTSATLNGRANQFCIAIHGVDVNEIKGIFVDLDEKGLAEKSQRFIGMPQLASEPLVLVGMIDSTESFVQDSWSRVFHDLCKEAGWAYKPKSIPNDLPSELIGELKLMETSVRGTGSPPTSSAIRQPPPRASNEISELPQKKRWWQFWKE